MSRGVLMYAHNNSEIDYFKIACANALMVKRNLEVPVTLVTDEGSLSWGEQSLGNSLITQCFENVKTVDKNWDWKNNRIFHDTQYANKTLQFYNCNHWEAYDLSPYDETLFIDADYLVMSSTLNKCWGDESDFMINHRIFSPGKDEEPYTKFIDDFGIKMYWATVIYFKKTSLSRSIFEIVRHIQQNYTYYRQLYLFSNGMFRNDNAFSIAVHMLNGFTNNEDLIKELPITGLLMSWDTDDIYTMNGINDITMYSEGKSSPILARIKNQDIHIMNKWAINRYSNNIIELYR